MDRRRFLDALKTEGFNVIYNLDLLQTYLPDKSKVEIKHLIETYTKKGKEEAFKLKEAEHNDRHKRTPIEQWYSVVHEAVPMLAKKDDFSNLLGTIFESQANEMLKKPTQQNKQDVDHQKKQHESNADQEETEANNNGNQDSEIDFSAVRCEINPNYSAVYQYIADVLNGKYPPELSPSDGLVVLSLIENLKKCNELSDFAEARQFIQQAKWWRQYGDADQQQPATTETTFGSTTDYLTLHRLSQFQTPSEPDGNETETSDSAARPSSGTEIGDYQTQLEMSQLQASEIVSTSMAASTSLSNLSEVVETSATSTSSSTVMAQLRLSQAEELMAYTEECLNYPKIKRIKSSLNPLDVPVELLEKQHHSLKSLMRKYL